MSGMMFLRAVAVRRFGNGSRFDKAVKLDDGDVAISFLE